MPHEEWAEPTAPAAPAALWSATLSSRQRVLLHAQPILGMRLNWSARDGEASTYDPLGWNMKLFEVVID
jgi:hypothetical protein